MTYSMQQFHEGGNFFTIQHLLLGEILVVRIHMGIVITLLTVLRIVSVKSERCYISSNPQST